MTSVVNIRIYSKGGNQLATLHGRILKVLELMDPKK